MQWNEKHDLQWTAQSVYSIITASTLICCMSTGALEGEKWRDICKSGPWIYSTAPYNTHYVAKKKTFQWKKYFLQHTVFVVYFNFVLIYLFLPILIWNAYYAFVWSLIHWICIKEAYGGWNLSFDLLTLKGHSQGQRSRSLGFVACQIEATVAWNMMVKIISLSGQPWLMGSRSSSKMPKIAFVWSLRHWVCT